MSMGHPRVAADDEESRTAQGAETNRHVDISRPQLVGGFNPSEKD